MARMTGGETITVKPTSNVYTVLVVVAFVAELIGFIALVAAAKVLIPPGIF